MTEDRTPLQRESDKKWAGRQHRWRAEATGRVVAWLRLHPYSTADEIFNGCGHGVGRLTSLASKFVRWQRGEDGVTRWYVDGERFEKVMNGE